MIYLGIKTNHERSKAELIQNEKCLNKGMERKDI